MVGTQPSTARSLDLYRAWADRYDDATAAFRGYRRLAVDRLRLRASDVVVDVGAGTGLCFPLIEDRIGPHGALIGLEPCPDMLERAASRVRDRRWTNVTLLCEPAEAVRLPATGDAALFCATHDILRSRPALENVLGQLRPGARVVAVGGKWAPPWMVALNLWVFALHLPFVTTFEGFERPWSHVEELVPDLQVQSVAWGAGFVAWGTRPG